MPVIATHHDSKIVGEEARQSDVPKPAIDLLGQIDRSHNSPQLDEVQLNLVGELLEIILHSNENLHFKKQNYAHYGDLTVYNVFLKFSPSTILAEVEFSKNIRYTRNVSDVLLIGKQNFYYAPGYIKVTGVYFSIFRNLDSINAYRVEDIEAKSAFKAANRVQKNLAKRPDLPRWAEANRSTELLQVRIAPEQKEALERAALEANQSKTDWVRDAIQNHLKQSPNRNPKP